jgi:cell division protein FtsN
MPAFLFMAVLIACSGTNKSASETPIGEYEEQFDPSLYTESDSSHQLGADPVEQTMLETESKEEYVTIERVEQKMGFRVQIFSTTSLDDAEMRRDEYRKSLGDSTAINIVFDAPYYKVRIGDFLKKSEAEQMTTELKNLGLNEAWIVRDKVNYIVIEKVLHR